MNHTLIVIQSRGGLDFGGLREKIVTLEGCLLRSYEVTRGLVRSWNPFK